MKLTPNFSASEFDVNEPWPTKPGYLAKRLELAQLLQRVRDLVASPIVITSAWRSDARNEAIGGSDTSQHRTGDAADAVAWLVPMRTIAARVLADIKAGTFPAFGQIIFYPVEGHVHVSRPTLGARNGEIRFKAPDGSYPFLASANQLPVFSAAQRRRGLWLGVAIALGVVGTWLIIRHFTHAR